MPRRLVRKNGQGVILDASVKRTKEGVAISLQSKVLDELFSRFHPQGLDYVTSSNAEWGVVKGKRLAGQAEIIAGDLNAQNCRINSWGEGGLYVDSQQSVFNFSMLRAVGLERKVTFEFKGLYTEEKINKWIDMLQRTVKKIYLNYLKPIDKEVVITYRETSHEQFL